MPALLATGCGNAIFAYQAESAARRIEEARKLGAQTYARYEFTLATEHYRKAQEEAAEADYGDAIHFAELSEAHAVRAARTCTAVRPAASTRGVAQSPGAVN